MVMLLLLPSPTKLANPPESPRSYSTCFSQCPMGPLLGLVVRRGLVASVLSRAPH